MKILFVSDLYPVNDSDTTAPRVLKEFVSKWIELGHQVKVLRPNFLLNSFLRKKKFYKTGQYNEVFNVNYFLPFMFDVTKKIPEFDYDVIIAHMPSGIIFSNHLKGKLICAVHNSDLEVLTNPLYNVYFKQEMIKAYKRASGIACRSQVLRKKFLKLFPHFEAKTFLCESGIDFEPELRAARKIKKVVTCAKLIKRKNIDKLILALKELPQLHLTVIGEGKELKRLKKLAGENVEFTGYLPHEEVLEIFKKSEIFVLPSIRETFGMVYLEALACGCIPVGTANDGIDGIINHGINGFLTTPSPQDIKNTLLEIINKLEDELNNILRNCYNTANCYNSLNCAEDYIKNILKNL